jgi:hypothetical protein
MKQTSELFWPNILGRFGLHDTLLWIVLAVTDIVGFNLADLLTTV